MAHTVFYVPWVGHDEWSGPDRDVPGSLHLTKADADTFFRDLRAKEAAKGYGQNHVPGYYVTPDSDPRPVSVNEAVYAKVAASKNGVWASKKTNETFSVS